MRIRVLGPVQIFTGAVVMEVGPAQRCRVLAALAADAGRLVSRAALVDRVWGKSPPGGAWRTIQTHIAHIRRVLTQAGALAQVVRVHRGGGYLLDIDPDTVDVHLFRRLAAQAQKRSGCADGLALWREAVDLWRGEPLAGLGVDWAERTRDAWYGEYRDAVLGWADAEIRAGDPTAVIGALTDLVG
ncbi:MAG TPA: winged helix-turn-helix domain-containing protein, partial [Pilimelia sp.]|nr:winged helix-turn-helix domain-containing protein [Pilimelia sp.]